MKALVYTGPKTVEVRDVEEPQCTKEKNVKIRIHYCGVCGSDIGVFLGTHPRAKAPLVLGHEFVGEIVEVNDSKKGLKVGDRVSAYPLISCGHCVPCRTGRAHVCETLGLYGIDQDGGMAEYICLPEDILFKLDDSISLKNSAIIEPMAVIIRELHQAKFKPLDTVVVLGAGTIGLLTAILLREMGASRILMADVMEERVKMCREMGFDIINNTETDLEKWVLENTKGEGADIVFECTGSEGAVANITRITKISGMICLTGVHKKPHALDLRDVNFKEQILVGTRVYTIQEFEAACEYIKKVEDKVSPVITHTIPLSQAENVFDFIADRKNCTAKVLIDCRK